MKDLQHLEKRLTSLKEEYNEYFRCHVRSKGMRISYDPNTIKKLSQLQRNIINTTININQTKMRLLNKRG